MEKGGQRIGRQQDTARAERTLLCLPSIWMQFMAINYTIVLVISKITDLALVDVAQLVGHCLVHRKVAGSVLSQDTHLCCRLDCW